MYAMKREVAGKEFHHGYSGRDLSISIAVDDHPKGGSAMNRHANSWFAMRRITTLMLVMVPTYLLGCATTERLTFTRMVPGTINLKAKGVQSLAVSDFDGPGDSGKTVAELFTVKLVDGKYYMVVEREKLNAAIKEQALGMSGMVDEKHAAKTGKVLGVDAVIVGKVGAYSVKDEPYSKTVMVSRATGTYRTICDKKGNCSQVENYAEVPVQERHHIRNGTVNVSFRVIRSETGEAMGGKDATENYKYDTGNPPSAGFLKGKTAELGGEEMLTTLARKVVETLVAELQPHQISYEGDLETGGGMFGDNEVKHGIELIRNGRLEDAIQYYEALVSRNPQNSSAYYNLGAAYISLDNIEKAEWAWRAAEKIEPKPLYIKAVGNIKKRKEELGKLMEQAK